MAVRPRVISYLAAIPPPPVGDEPPETPPDGTRFSTGEDLYLLLGPTLAPAGAVTVNPATDDLGTVTTAQPAGTTFYLLAGKHQMGGGSPTAFNQVIPKAGNTYIGAPGAILDGRNVNRYAFTGTAANVTIRYLEVTNFVCLVDEFVVNHDSGDNWTIEYCNFHSNGGASMAIGSGSTVRYSWLHHNGQYGFSCYKPPVNDALTNAVQNVTVDHCEVHHNGNPRDEFQPDGTLTNVGRNGSCKFWDVNGITFTNSWIHHSYQVAIWADTNNVAARIEGNLVEDNWGEGFFYEISYNFLVQTNTFRRNAIGKGLSFNYRGSDGFPVAAIYVSEAGSESRIGGLYSSSSEITNNKFVNNWGIITLWENADRFCNSPANTSAKVYKPLGGAATLGVCNNTAGKSLTVTLTSGSPNFTVTAGGTLESTDEGRSISGTGIPGGAKIKEPLTSNGFVGGYTDATHGVMNANASSSGSVTMTVTAGTISVDPAFYDCRWHTRGIDIHHNTFDHNESEVLGGNNTLQGSVVTGKHSVLSQFGSYPAWSPYTGTTVQTAITFNQSNTWRSNTYRGGFVGMPFDTGTTKTFTQWQATPYFQDAGSTRNATNPTGGGGGTWYKPAAPTGVTGTAGNAQVRVDFTPPTDIGGDFIVGYTATSSPGGFTATGVTGPLTVSGLTNNTAYTFTVTCRNTIGQSVASSASGSVTPTSGSSLPGTTRPWHPTHVTARQKVGANTVAQVSFLPPVSTGGSAITSYTVTASPGGATGSASLGPIEVSGLSVGQPYTFTVTATNAAGTSPPSPASTAITLEAPFAAAASSNGRYIVDQDGNGYLGLFDTIWPMVQQAGRDSSGDWQNDMDHWIDTRASQGFNGLKFNLFGNVISGANADLLTDDNVSPFNTTNPATADPTQFNSTYWTRVDYLIDQAAASGLTCWIHIAYKDDVAAPSGTGWMQGHSNAEYTSFGTILANRYKDRPNIVWVYGGDYFDESATQLELVADAMTAAGDTHLVTVQNYSDASGTPTFYTTSRKHSSGTTLVLGSAVATVEALYTYARTFEAAEQAYTTSPALPLVYYDGYYDGGDDLRMRRETGWALTTGTYTSQYGSEALWAQPVGWRSNLTSKPQLVAMVAAVDRATGWESLVPDFANVLVTGGAGSGNTTVTAAKRADGTLALIYIPNAASAITVSWSTMAASNRLATWIDPTSGAQVTAAEATSYSRSANAAGAADWLLKFTAG